MGADAVPSHLQAMAVAEGYCTHLPNVPVGIMLPQPQQRRGAAGGEASSCCTVLCCCCCVGGGPLVWIRHTSSPFYGTTLDQEALPFPTASPHRCCDTGFLVLCSVQAPEELVSQMLFDVCICSSDRATTLLSARNRSVTAATAKSGSTYFKRQRVLCIR